MKNVIPLLAFLSIISQFDSGFAQTKNHSIQEDANDATAEIAIVALGPKPPRRYRETDGGATSLMLFAQPGETPPSRLFFEDDTRKKNEERWISFNLAFNNPSNFKEFPAGKELGFYRQVPESDERELYVKLPSVAAGTRTVIFLTAKKFGATPWDHSPRIRTIQLDQKKLVDKQFILANFSRHTVEHAFEGKVEVVKPDKILTYPRNEVGEIYRLAARYGAEQKIIYNTAVRLDTEGHIQLFALYDANPETNGGRDVGVFRTMIAAQNAEQKDADSPAR